MTIIEMTVVILVLIALISLLFIGANAWKRGSDRASCIMNLQNIQKGVRSFANLHGHAPGDNVAGLRDRVIGPGKFLEHAPLCPGTGLYEYGRNGDSVNSDMVPPVGVPYASCTLADEADHRPPRRTDW
jgi:type II secretory pathway pseudopilin PulG